MLCDLCVFVLRCAFGVFRVASFVCLCCLLWVVCFVCVCVLYIWCCVIAFEVLFDV